MASTDVAPSVADLDEGEQPTSAVWIEDTTYAYDERGNILKTRSYDDYGIPIWQGAKKVKEDEFGPDGAGELLYVAVSAVEGAAKKLGKAIKRLPVNP